METLLLPGIGAQRVPTDRLTANVLEVTGRTGTAVLFVHGNVSRSAVLAADTCWPWRGGHRPLAVDLRGFGDTEPGAGGCHPRAA